MSALPKPSIDDYSIPAKHYSSRRTRYRKNSLSSKVRQSQSKDGAFPQSSDRALQRSSPQTFQFPQVQPLPAKLKVLLLVQKSSLGLALILIASSIAVYVSTVRIPELWSKKYQDLETLQRQERQLVAANESLKHKLAQQAQEKDSNLALITSNNTIFIPQAPPSQPKQTNLEEDLRETSLKNMPMGY